MSSNPQPTVAACPKCNVVLVPVEVKSGCGGAVVGGLLIFFGIIGLLVHFVVGLVLMGLGIVVMAVSGKRPGLMCPSCGARGVTLGEIANKVTPSSPASGPSSRVNELIAIGIAVAAAGLVWFFATHSSGSRPAPPAPPESAQPHAAQPANAWVPPEGVVVTRISRDHYRADDGRMIVTSWCKERAEKVSAILRYDTKANTADNTITFPSGPSCVIASVGKSATDASVKKRPSFKQPSSQTAVPSQESSPQ